ncbi:MAG: FkbM family methyltransferase [Proteobacteria bacterium]|nr:FkbM family methyltransferase [Pseudomonadota bacterium]
MDPLIVSVIELLRRFKRSLYKRPRPGLNDLDRKLEPYLDFDHGFFIECGANDGYTQSNTYYLEKRRGWRGLLIEGIPELHARCRQERTRSTVHQCALVADDYRESTVTMHYANLMSLVDGAMKTPEEQAKHVSDGNRDTPGHYSVDVPARTLTAILDETPDLPAIDFFSLDVEGYELSVLKGLDLERYRPRYILVEARYFEEIDHHLVDAGYDLLATLTLHDYLYQAR